MVELCLQLSNDIIQIKIKLIRLYNNLYLLLFQVIIFYMLTFIMLKTGFTGLNLTEEFGMVSSVSGLMVQSLPVLSKKEWAQMVSEVLLSIGLLAICISRTSSLTKTTWRSAGWMVRTGKSWSKQPRMHRKSLPLTQLKGNFEGIFFVFQFCSLS